MFAIMTTMDETTKATLKHRLEDELKTLTDELNNVGRQNPQNPADWEAEAPQDDVQPGDLNEAADRIEGYEENTAILKELETRYNNVKDALKRLGNGSYGVCEVGGEPIEAERLKANPAARTCITHKDENLA